MNLVACILARPGAKSGRDVHGGLGTNPPKEDGRVR